MATRLKGILMSLFIFNWITKGFNAMVASFKKGFQNLIKYSEEMNKTMSDFKSQSEQLKNSLAVAFSPILNAVVPLLTRLVEWLNVACNALARFFAFLSGKNSYTAAKKRNEDYAGSLDGVKDSAQSAGKALAGFDDLNVLGSGTGGALSSVGDLFEEVPIENISNWMKSFKEAIKNEDWYAIGALLASKLNEAMYHINWIAIKKKQNKLLKILQVF